MSVVCVDVPTLLFDLLLTTSLPCYTSSSSVLGELLSHCVRLLRALSRGNDLIQRRIFDCAEALLSIQAIHGDIALLVRDVSYLILSTT